ncbi:hypothetical protein B0T25DRAFT_565716 [Lasiosphaeria hispida]|uniref:Uncharacterized protein n=1 Tax=Lasiosphaeria hispida TaxID=260671 RepID=A0AAJ0MF55_9PEZI|nr:hypothetical protein B0T25DRAFT_565716 [Lasiosphaeria hispida]
MARTRSQTGAQQRLPSLALNDQGHPVAQTRTSKALPPPTRNEANRTQSPTSLYNHSTGRKRKQPIEDALESSPDPAQKRQRTSDTRRENTSGEPATGTGASRHATDPIAFWARDGRRPEVQYWPEETSQTDSTMERIKRPP